MNHIPGGLEGLLQGDLNKHPEGADGADAGVLDSHLHQNGVVAEGLEEGADEEEAEDKKAEPAKHPKEKPVGGGGVGLLLALLPQAAADKAVEADPGAHTHRDYQHLHREGQAHRRQGVYRVVLGDKDAVHNVVQRLHQHGEHGGQGHRKD